jgi:methionyl-tRNA formyltransferase
MKIIFMGTPEFSAPILQALVDAGHDIAAVYSQPPRPSGRGQKLRPSPVQALAETLNLDTRYPTSLKTPEALEEFASVNADIAVVVAYGLILPQAILDAPTHGCLNIHASLLPRWRGAAPIHRAIMAGDSETGVCIMQMEAGLDTGPVLLRQTTKIHAAETTQDLHDRLSEIGADAICLTLETLHSLTPEPQSEDGVTYAQKIDKAEAKIDWTQSSEIIDRQIRGLSPFPGAWTTQQGNRLKLLGSELGAAFGTPGEVLDKLTIACGTGSVKITRAQRAGKAAQDAEAFAQTLPPGTILGG